MNGVPIELTDLSAPVFPESLHELLEQVAAVGPTLELTPAALMAAASSETGLTEFGDSWFLEPLEVLCRSLRDEAGLSPLGVTMTWSQLVGLLKNRLQLEKLIADHPEIEQERIARPVIIAGLPRTGTTHLHNLLSADPGLRHLPYWESLEPVLPEAERGVIPDPRLERARSSLELVNAAMPHFAAMHEMTFDHAHEEIQLLALTFSTMLFETLAPTPSYRDWLGTHDQAPAYSYLKRALQALQWSRGTGRWVLKSPQHLAQFRTLLATFPDATFVITHRDPVSVTTSMATMAAYTARLQLAQVDPVRIGRYWAQRVEDLLNACARDRHLLPAAQSIDVRFDDFMADEWGTVEDIYRAAGHPLTDEARACMREFMRDHPRGRHGRVAYRADVLGLDVDERRTALASYSLAFGLADETLAGASSRSTDSSPQEVPA